MTNSSHNLHRSLFCDGQTRTACGLKSPFRMKFVMADRDRLRHRCGTSNDCCPSLSDKLLPKTYIAVLSARADPKRLSTGTSVLCKPLSFRVLLSPQLGNDPGIGVNRSRKLHRGINAVKVWGTNFSSSQSNMTEAVRAIGVPFKTR